jgi:hypothetical protein
MSATRQLNPHNFFARGIGDRTGPAYKFDNMVAAAEKHQPAPVG